MNPRVQPQFRSSEVASVTLKASKAEAALPSPTSLSKEAPRRPRARECGMDADGEGGLGTAWPRLQKNSALFGWVFGEEYFGSEPSEYPGRE